jgi:hypothetical protein
MREHSTPPDIGPESLERISSDEAHPLPYSAYPKARDVSQHGIQPLPASLPLVDFARAANDAIIGDELEKVIVTPSGIAGQRFDPLDFHRLELSLRAGSLATASL